VTLESVANFISWVFQSSENARQPDHGLITLEAGKKPQALLSWAIW
jgi:hypothetical protein